MSHEIRTPMNAILGMLQLLEQTDLNSRQLDYVSKTESAARSLLGLLNDILDFSKVEAGKLTLDPHPFRSEALMRNLAVILSGNVGNKPVEVIFAVDPQLPPVLIGDLLRIQQVLINLGGNAVKFTERGEVVIRVDVLSQEADRVRVRFMVQDTGIGISPEQQQRIFTGFTQAEASTTRRFGGTGLGLAISQRLVSLMGSELKLESALGVGSRFWFDLELPVGDAAELTQSSPMIPRAQAGLAGLRVLIVDDNPLARDGLATMAQSLGWQAELAASGEEALQRLRQADAHFDIVFVDWMMPGMDGWQTTESIRKRPGGQVPLVMMVSANAREAMLSRSPEEQALLDAYLTKPVTASMLVDAVAEARAHRGQSQVEAPKPARAAASRALEGLRVLLVEDNAINQQVAAELLANQGARVEVAANGRLAVEALESDPSRFDVVLMDLQMPEMDGFTATREIRQRLGLRELPIIAMTANAMESDREASLQAGMNDHIGKPFELRRLVELLLHYCPTPRVTGGVPSQSSTATASEQATPVDPRAQWRGLRWGEAVQRLGGDEAMFWRMVSSFEQELVHLREPILLMDEAEREVLQRHLHTLKGLAATLGADALREAARTLESAVKSGTPLAALTTQRQALIELMQRTTDDFETLRAQRAGAGSPSAAASPGPGAAEVPSAAPAPAAIDRAELEALDRLLHASDLEALPTIERLVTRYPEDAWLRSIQEAIGVMDFTAARARIAERLRRG